MNTDKIANEILYSMKKIEVVKNKYLEFPDGGMTSFDGPGESEVVVSNGRETMRIHEDSKRNLYGYTDKYDKNFRSLDDLAKFLNKNKFKFVGID